LDGGDALTSDREVDVEQGPLDLACFEQVLDVEVGDQGVGLVDHESAANRLIRSTRAVVASGVSRASTVLVMRSARSLASAKFATTNNSRPSIKEMRPGRF